VSASISSRVVPDRARHDRAPRRQAEGCYKANGQGQTFRHCLVGVVVQTRLTRLERLAFQIGIDPDALRESLRRQIDDRLLQLAESEVEGIRRFRERLQRATAAKQPLLDT
jgi:hypothetical protein